MSDTKSPKKDVDALLSEVATAAKAGKPAKAKAAPAEAAAAAPATKAAKAEPKAEPRAEAKAAPAPKRDLKIKQVRSAICAPADQKHALRCIGLRRIRHEVVRPDNPSIRGQILKVRHLVEVVPA